MKNTVYSGIQPSGNLHLGNYLGMITQSVKLQNSGNYDRLLFNIADLHTITIPQDPIVLREKILELSALFIACGIDPDKSHIFIQSENSDHPYLTWILDCFINYGELSRMTQFKDKSKKPHFAEALRSEAGKSGVVTVGLFNYPALMAADVLLYDTDFVPVGQDQSQHLELTCDVAKRFNNKYNKVIFKIPKTLIDKDAARIMSLSNPAAKMSKSDNDPNGTINILDKPDEIAKKISRAVTDSGTEIIYQPDKKPAITNLLTIYSKFTNKKTEEIVNRFQNKGYAEFKKELAEIIITQLAPVQQKYNQIRQENNYLHKILNDGLNYAKIISSKKIAQVKTAIGLTR